ncbi:cell division cycle-associated protein 2-like [Hoplias malabaricus]|uniref:cell division cycle-associated protein 2-like n=1 Tax=Hoplias malabaricus TaxID=27720 RepID=UPI003461DF18
MDSIEVVGSRTPLGALSSSQQNSEAGDADFTKLTPSDFSISTDSFLTFSKEKDKSRVAQLKLRRRSNIGARGSPETNSLIRFRAKAALKTQTPQHMLPSPLFSGCNSIKQKMAAFQRLMGEDEENLEQSATLMAKEEEGDGGVSGSLSKDVQTDTDFCLEEREDQLTTSRHQPATTAPPSKKRRRVPLGLCAEEIQEEPLSDLQKTEEPGALSSEFKCPEPKPGPGLDSQSQLMSFPMLSKPEVIRTDDIEVSSVSKKKHVRFGVPLSPEFFDKTLPPSTPLRKGATPMGLPTSTGRKSSLRKTPQRFDPPLPQPDFNSPNNGASPVLSTFRCRSTEVDNDEVFLEIEKISFPIMDEEFDNPSADSKDTSLAEGPELTLHHKCPTAQPGLMNTAFQEEEDHLPPPTADHSLPFKEAEPEPDLQQQSQQESPVSTTETPRSRGRKRKQPAEKEKETETRRSSRTAAASDKGKMKQPAENERETRRSSRTAAASANGKLKISAAKKKFGSKEVDRSLYGKREYASKNPLLSPIIESAASRLTITAAQAHPDENSDSSPTTTPSIHHGIYHGQKTDPDHSNVTTGLVAAAALWRKRFLQQPKENNATNEGTHVSNSVGDLQAVDESVDTIAHTGTVSSGRKALRSRRSTGRPAGRRRSWNSARMNKIGNALESEQEGGLDKELNGQMRLTDRPQAESVLGGKIMHENSNQSESSENIVGCETDHEEVNGHFFTAEHSDAKLVKDTDEEPELKAPDEKKHGQKTLCVKSTTVMNEKEEEPCQGPLETMQSADHKEEGEKGQELTVSSLAVKQSELSSVETLRAQNEPVLESWQQANFNIEDIFKPVVKNRGSVRRSLRNRRSMDIQASGLAWVDHTSPELVTASRRRTRSRLSAVYQPADPEETQANQGE